MKVSAHKKHSTNFFNYVYNRQKEDSKKIKQLLRKYKLSEILFQNRYIENLFSHVFLGFSADGAYLLSYTTSCCHSLGEDPNPNRDFRLLIQYDDGADLSAHPNYFLLHLWRFEPGLGLKFVHKIRLFNSECLGENSYIVLTQTKACGDASVPKPILVYGCNLDKLGGEGFGQRCYKCHLSLIFYDDRALTHHDSNGGLTRDKSNSFIINIKHQFVNTYSEFFRREYLRPSSGYLLVHLCDSIIGIKVHFLQRPPPNSPTPQHIIDQNQYLGSNDGASTSSITSTPTYPAFFGETTKKLAPPSPPTHKGHLSSDDANPSPFSTPTRSAPKRSRSVLHDSVKLHDAYFALPGHLLYSDIPVLPPQSITPTPTGTRGTPDGSSDNLQVSPNSNGPTNHVTTSSGREPKEEISAAQTITENERVFDCPIVPCANYLDLNVSTLNGTALSPVDVWDTKNLERCDLKIEQRVFDIEAYLSEFTSLVFRERYINVTIYDYDMIIVDGGQGVNNCDNLVSMDLEILIKLTFDGLTPANDSPSGTLDDDPLITFVDTTKETIINTLKNTNSQNPYEWPGENLEDAPSENVCLNSLKIISSHYYSTSVKLVWDLQNGQVIKIPKDLGRNRIVFRRVLNHAFWRPSHSEYKLKKATKSFELSNIYHTLTNISLLKGQSLKSIDHPFGIYSIML